MRYLGIAILVLILFACIVSCDDDEDLQYGFDNIIYKVAVSDYVISIGSMNERGTRVEVDGGGIDFDESFDGEYHHYLWVDGQDMTESLTFSSVTYAEFVLPVELESGQSYPIQYRYQQIEDDIHIIDDQVSGDIIIAYYPIWTKPDSIAGTAEEVTFAWEMEDDNLMQAAYALSEWYDEESNLGHEDDFVLDLLSSDRSFTFPANCLDDFDMMNTDLLYSIYSLNYTNTGRSILMSYAMGSVCNYFDMNREVRRAVNREMAKTIQKPQYQKQ